MNNDLARQTLDRIKELLEEEPKSYTDETINEHKLPEEVIALPITHNEDKIMLVFNGWCITLMKDGTYFWSDEGGG